MSTVLWDGKNDENVFSWRKLWLHSHSLAHLEIYCKIAVTRALIFRQWYLKNYLLWFKYECFHWLMDIMVLQCLGHVTCDFALHTAENLDNVYCTCFSVLGLFLESSTTFLRLLYYLSVSKSTHGLPVTICNSKCKYWKANETYINICKVFWKKFQKLLINL